MSVSDVLRYTLIARLGLISEVCSSHRPNVRKSHRRRSVHTLFLFVLQVSALPLRLVDDLTDDPTDIVPNTDGTALVLDGIDPDFCFVLFNGAEQLLEISLPKAATSRPLFHFGFGFGVTIAANALNNL